LEIVHSRLVKAVVPSALMLVTVKENRMHTILLRHRCFSGADAA